MQPLLHERTKRQIDIFLKRPSHGVLLTGEDGIGKYYVATWLAQKLSDEVITLIPPEDKTTITIEQIRQLYAITKTGSSLTIIIKDAQLMGTEAQNAFLKLLEEPPKNTSFILTATSSNSMLQTIRSRCQHIEVVKPLVEEILQHAGTLDTSVDSAQQQAFLHSTNGLPGTFFSLLTDTKQAEAYAEVLAQAKQFYSGKPYDRYVLCATNNYEKDWALQLLNVLSIIIKSLLNRTAADDASRTKLLQQADLLQSTTRAIADFNANVKIQLAQLIQKL